MTPSGYDRSQQLISRIREVWSGADPETVVAVSDLVERDAEAIADLFYATLMEDAEARQFLDHELVRSRLKLSLVHWLRGLFDKALVSRAQDAVRRFREIGTVHVRMNLPWFLINHGVRVIRGDIFERILGQGWAHEKTIAALRFSLEALELAAEGMNGPFFEGVISNVRYQQSLRVMMTGHGLALECERIKASLLAWHRDAVVALLGSGAQAEVPLLSGTELGLWITHKAAFTIGELPEYETMCSALEEIDACFKHALGSSAGGLSSAQLHPLGENVATLAYVLSSVSEKAMEAESGRDVLTRLLNRRFLPAILQQEVSFSQRHARPFAVLIIDADHFKSVNDTHGHQTGDAVLVQLAQAILSMIRTSDYMFRYGGEEFLVLLSEVDREIAARKAEEIRAMVASTVFKSESVAHLELTISIGVALHDGHPDFERVIQAADHVLLQAKRAGRNRVVVHSQR